MRLTTFREGEMRLTNILLCIFSSMLGIVNILRVNNKDWFILFKLNISEIAESTCRRPK